MLRRAFLTSLSAAAPLLGVQAPHRVVFDTWLADKFGSAAGFAAANPSTNSDAERGYALVSIG